MNKRIKEMFTYLEKGRGEVQPSKLWWALIKLQLKKLNQYGYKNFKRTLVRQYSAYVPIFLLNTQIVFLVTHLNPITTLKALYKSLTLPTHDCFTWIDSASLNFITYLLWDYLLKVDKDRIWEKLDEPLLGNPPGIYYQNKLISQDLANSILEFKSIFDEYVNREQIRVIADLGAGCGRDAVAFSRLLPKLQKYLIIDIPPALALAEKYISDLFPRDKIFKFRPFTHFSQVAKEYQESKFLFFLPNQIELIPSSQVDLFLNISSLHEMRLDQVRYYFRQIERLTKLQSYFYFKEFKNAYVAHEDVYIKIKDYPLAPKWQVLYLRECKVQIKFFECLAQLTKK